MLNWSDEKVSAFVQKHFYGFLLRRGSPVPSEAAANLVQQVLSEVRLELYRSTVNSENPKNS